MKVYLMKSYKKFAGSIGRSNRREIDIVLEHDGVLNPIEIKKTSNPRAELIRVFGLLKKSSTPCSKGAVICMKPDLNAIDRDNYIVPVWLI